MSRQTHASYSFPGRCWATGLLALAWIGPIFCVPLWLSNHSSGQDLGLCADWPLSAMAGSLIWAAPGWQLLWFLFPQVPSPVWMLYMFPLAKERLPRQQPHGVTHTVRWVHSCRAPSWRSHLPNASRRVRRPPLCPGPSVAWNLGLTQFFSGLQGKPSPFLLTRC